MGTQRLLYKLSEFSLREIEPSDSTYDSGGSSSIITLIKLIEDPACFQQNSLLSLSGADHHIMAYGLAW